VCPYSDRPLLPIGVSTVDDLVWTFERAGQRLEIRREEADSGTRMILVGEGLPRTYCFDDPDRLLKFQKDMESLLLQTGWSFVSFSPDRRSGAERRDWPRLDERRRWWTDGLRSLAPARWFKSG
jgi:hypothetical protein